MAMPKSVTKINKDGVTFISNVVRTQYTLNELARAALRDTARLLRRQIKANTPVDEGILRRNVGSWLRKSTDGVPYLQVGVYDRERAKRKGYKYAYHAHLQEFGTRKMPAANGGQGFMGYTVRGAIDDIRRIQGQYLQAIEDENKARGLIDESEEIADD